jgi:hypothetical protein
MLVKDTTKSANWFVRALIVIFCSFLVVLVIYKFFVVDPKADFSPGLLVVLAFILLLVLSELFDNFSIAQLVSVSRDLKKRDAETALLKDENSELRGNLITISTNISQKQTSTNILGLPSNFAELLTVRQAAAEEIESKKNEEQPSVSANPEPERVLVRSKAEEFAVSRFVVDKNLQAFNLIREAKLSTQFSEVDPIRDITPIFDAYINTSDSEVFIEVRITKHATLAFRDRLYMMLIKLHKYKTLKKSDVHLALLMVNLPDGGPRPSVNNIDRLKREFGPAITSGLLRINEIDPTPEEVHAIYRPASIDTA